MCGACGTNGAGHWSAPFLASQPARAAAATAVTVMAGRRVTVAGTPGGYLVSTPTGRRHAVPDLGQVWDVVAPPGSPSRMSEAPVSLHGPATLPTLRATLTRVVLLVAGRAALCGSGTARPDGLPAGFELDARRLGTAELLTRLREFVDCRRSQEIRVLVADADVENHLAGLRAHPARPFGVTRVADLGDHNPDTTVPRWTTGSFERLPAVLAWLAALDGSTPSCQLRLRLPMPDRRTLSIDLLRGVLTRCELLAQEEVAAESVNRRDPLLRR